MLLPISNVFEVFGLDLEACSEGVVQALITGREVAVGMW